MADNTVELGIEIENSEALKALRSLEKQATSSVSVMEKAFSGLKLAAGAAVAFFAGREVVQFFEQGIEAAIAQEQALANLTTQLELTGEASSEAISNFADLADELEKTTKFEDDVILSNIALAKSFGITNEQATELIKAATDLSVATGKDLESSVRLLGKTYSGVLGPLDEVDNSLKGLTKEQLANGEAVRVLAKRFEGAANNEIQTYSGALNQAQKSFGNFAEAFGKIITENKAVKTFIQAIGDAFAKLQVYVENNESSISSFITNGLTAFVASVSASIDVIKFFGKALGGAIQIIGLARSGLLELADAASLGTLSKFSESFVKEQQALFESIDKSAQKTQDFDDMMTELGKSVDNLGQKIAEADNTSVEGANKATKARNNFSRSIGITADELKKLTDEAIKFEQEITKSSSSELNKLLIDREENLKKIKEFEKQKVITVQNAINLRQKVEEDFSKKVIELADKTGKEQRDIALKAAEETKAKIQQAATEPIKFLIEGNFTTDSGAAFGVGIANSMLKGAEGAKDLIAKGVGAIADTIIPGIGGAVSELVAILAKGPEETKKQVRAFVEAVPEIVTAIAESVPAFVEALVDSLINEGGIVRISIAFAQAMSGEAVWKAIGKQIGFEVGNKLTDGAKQVGIKIADGFKQAAARLGEAFMQFGNQMSTLFTNFFAGLDVAFSGAAQRLWDTLANAGTMFADSLGKVLSDAGQGFVNAISGVFTGIFDGLKSALSFSWPSIPTPSWIQDIKDAPGNLLAAFAEIPSKIANEISKALGLGGNDGGADNSVKGKVEAGFENIKKGKLPRFASGGIVPPGFPDDSFPARLTSNELVVRDDITPKLERFLDGESSSVTNALLAQMIQLLSQPMQVSTTANLNGKALADIILQLNRNNARLSA